MMENEIGYGQEKKYGAIKITKLRNIPCTIQFVTNRETGIEEFFLVIDTKSEETTINCD